MGCVDGEGKSWYGLCGECGGVRRMRGFWGGGGRGDGGDSFFGGGGGGNGMFGRVRREGERIELGFSAISN